MKWSIEDIVVAMQDISSWPLLFKWASLFLTGMIILGIGYKIDIVKQRSLLKAQQKEQEKLHERIERQQQLVTILEGYQGQIKEIQAILQEYYIHFSEKKEIPLLLETITQSHHEALIFHQIKLLPESHTADYSVQPIEISVKGTYQGLTEFIEKIATFSKLITFDDFVIRAKVDPTHAYLQMTLEAKLYYKNEEPHA